MYYIRTIYILCILSCITCINCIATKEKSTPLTTGGKLEKVKRVPLTIQGAKNGSISKKLIC